MAQALLGNLRVDSIGQQLRRVAVPEIVETHWWQIFHPSRQTGKFASEAPWQLRLTVLPAVHQSFAGLPNAEPQ